jgi:hypothetical protein
MRQRLRRTTRVGFRIPCFRNPNEGELHRVACSVQGICCPSQRTKACAQRDKLEGSEVSHHALSRHRRQMRWRVRSSAECSHLAWSCQHDKPHVLYQVEPPGTFAGIHGATKGRPRLNCSRCGYLTILLYTSSSYEFTYCRKFQVYARLLV